MTLRSRGGSEAIAARIAVADFAAPRRRWSGAGRLRRHERGGQRRAVDVLAGRERRRRLDGVDADDRAAEPRLVGADARGEIGERRLGAELAAQLLARGLELAALAAHAARPGVAAQRVDHRAAHAALGEGLELDAARFVEAAGGVDQPEHAVLHEVAELDRVRHRGGDPARQRLDERQAGGDSVALIGFERLTLHGSLFRGRCRSARSARDDATGEPVSATAIPRRKAIEKRIAVSALSADVKLMRS